MKIAASNLAVLTLFVTTSLTVIAVKDAGAAGKQYVYARSQTQSNSPTMGVAGVPAYVVMSNGQRRGVYITQTGNNGYWRSIGLRTGYVLLTLDNKVIESADDIESYLMSKNPSANIGYSYAAIAGGAPRFVSGRMSYTGKHVLGATTYPSMPSSRSAVVGPSSSADDHKNEQSTVSELESHMVKLINRDRSTNGLSSVSENGKLTSLARSHAEYLLKVNTMAHNDGSGKNPTERAHEAGIRCSVTENLSSYRRGMFSDKKAVERAQNSMLNERTRSQSHKINMLSPTAQYVGVGIARNQESMIIVQEFADESP